MSVIIRLQNLPWSANALDIRQYFQGLSIPEGGVHIVGGELGDAFIAFSTDEDARQAMLVDGGKIKEVKIKLFLSSRSEMQKVIEMARAQSITLQTFMQMPSAQMPATAQIPTPAQIPATPMPATQIPPTPPQTAPAMPPMPPISQRPTKTATPEIKPPPLPPLPPIPAAITPEITKMESEPEKKDQDTESVSSKDAKRSRRGGRSRSKSKNRSKSRDRSKSRERSKSRDRSRSRDRSYRSKDRYRDRRRRDRSRSRDRRDRRRYRDRSRSRDRTSRKTSRDRKRDSRDRSDRNDRNSLENSSGAKSSIVPEKEVEIPLPVAPVIPVPTTKPGFSTSGWVTSGTVDKPASVHLPSPIGFSIGKPPPNAPVSLPQPPQPPQPRHSMMTLPQQIPLPQQMQIPHQMPTPPQVPTTQPTPPSHPLHMPQPPSFPQLPLEMPTDHDGRFGPMSSFTNTTPQPASATQPNALFGRNQPQLPRNEPNNMMTQNETGSLQTPTGWPPLRPPMDHSHMLSALQQPPNVINSMDKSAVSSPMTVGMGMYNRQAVMPPTETFQPPYVQQDPRVQSGFTPTQPRNDYRSSERPFLLQVNNFNPLEKQTNYLGREYDSKNPRDVFSNACVEIRNMSMNTTNADIHRFFQGLQVPGDGIKIITDKKGNKVGMAYVRFTKAFFKDLALKKTGQTLKNSVVEVLHIEDSIFDKAADFSKYSGRYFEDSHGYNDNYNDNFNDQDEPNETFTDLVIHEVPPYAKDRDIYNLFKGYKISDAFVLLRTGRKSATGYVRFRTPADARKALASSSRLAVGYTNVKAAICYEHEFADARDRKNMEENDEEMLEPKDVGFVPHESRGSRDSKKYPSYDFGQERSDPRYSQSEKRPQSSKGLLPTPPFKSFDPRTTAPASNSNSNSSFQSRFDRRQDLPPRSPREDFHKKPYGREDFHQKSYPREDSRFQPKSTSRDDPNKKQMSQGEFYKKSEPHSEIHQKPQEQGELFKKSQTLQYPTHTAKVAPSEQPTPVQETSGPKALQTDSNIKTENKNENEMEVTKSDPDIKDTPDSVVQNNTQLTEPNHNAGINPPSETTPADIQSVEQKGEMISQNEHKQVNAVEQRECHEIKAEQIKEDAQRPMDCIETDCIILRGLPFTASDRDILDFFSDEGLVPTQIHIMLDKQEQPAGDAFCEFSTMEEVARALTKNRTLMGRSLVAVEPVSREEMMEALGAVVPHPDHPHPDFPPEFSRQDHRFPRMPPHFLQRGRGRGNFRGRHLPPTERELESQNVNAFGKPGCVVALENVPYRAEVQDILDFFRGFYVPRDNVIRRFDENGKPTGDARVCLSTPMDAHRAVRTLNYRPIFQRQIHITIVP